MPAIFAANVSKEFKKFFTEMRNLTSQDIIYPNNRCKQKAESGGTRVYEYRKVHCLAFLVWLLLCSKPSRCKYEPYGPAKGL